MFQFFPGSPYIQLVSNIMYRAVHRVFVLVNAHVGSELYVEAILKANHTIQRCLNPTKIDVCREKQLK